jgi:hypothetical protein
MSGLQFLAKKSWHPKNLKNVQRVARVEKEKRDEDKKMLELRKQIEEEREAMEYRKMQEANGGKVASKRLDWMYNDPAAKRGNSSNTNDDDDVFGNSSKGNSKSSDKEEIEQFLLGNKSISEVVQQKTLKDIVPTLDGKGPSSSGSSSKAVPGARFIQNKPINEKNETFRRKHEDPLFAIMSNKESKRREVLSNPILVEKLKREHARKELEKQKAKLLKKEMKKKKKDAKKKKKEKKKEKKRRKKEKKKLKNNKDKNKKKRVDSSSDTNDSSSNSDNGDDDKSTFLHKSTNGDSINMHNSSSSKKDADGPNTAGDNSKMYGLQYPRNAPNVSNCTNNTNNNDASLGPTSYIIGKRKRYIEDSHDGNNRRHNVRGNDDAVDSFLKGIEKMSR